ncbi:hypothetical protein IWW45_003714 [Coemansia sp. RSA 485]|nr:hypothetical protein IWW45_003714 [Coemansia sp. RSA 485]KAJ2594429.1 hypothetical protein GGF39_004206 [Coemansia sp. RSA 1721]
MSTSTSASNTKTLFEQLVKAAKSQRSSLPEGSARFGKDDPVRERVSYKPLISFISTTAKEIQKSSEVPSRFLVPHKRTDTAMVNGEAYSCVEIVLKCSDISSELVVRKVKDQAYYKDVFAIIEVKQHATASEQSSGFEQLV